MTPDGQPIRPKVWTDVQAAAGRRGWRLLDRSDLDDLPGREWLVDEVLPLCGVVALVGARGLGKTFLATSIAAAVASDGIGDWAGLNLLRHGPVLYVALEGFAGIPERLLAWEKHHGVSADQVYWVNAGGLDLKDQAVAETLASVADMLECVLVIVDSARAGGAGAEDTRDMGDFVKGLELVKHRIEGCVLVLHNTGWNGDRERGSTVFGDAADVVLRLKGGNGTARRTLTSTKNRDGDPERLHLCWQFLPVAGTQSGVMVLRDSSPSGSETAKVPPASEQSVPSWQEELRGLLRDSPGLATSAYARLLGRPRQTVSTHLHELRVQGQVMNRGTDTRPKWCLSDSSVRSSGPKGPD